MTALADETVAGFLARLGAEEPAPGGGAAAAFGCACAAELVRMASSFTLARPELEEVHPRMRELRERAGEIAAALGPLADRDAEAYGRVIEAYRLPRDQAGRDERVAAALSGAADVPLEILAAGAELAALGAELAERGNPNLRGDAVTAALLAEAGGRAAANLVELNLADAPEDERLARTRGLAAEALAGRERALQAGG